MKYFQSVRTPLLLFVLAATSSSLMAQPIQLQRAFNGSGGAGPGTAMARHIIASPTALCNDGTAAVAYVQAATSAVNANDWIISMEGGGSCSNAQECLDRWQRMGIQSMSTSIPRATWNAFLVAAGLPITAPNGWTAQTIGGVPSYAVPPAISLGGILSNAAANPFAGWNKVHINYCSSDNHLGQQPFVANMATSSWTGAAVNFDLQFQGAAIFDGLIANLRAGVIACPFGAGNPCQTMPTLNSASTILLTGSSAGSQGAQDTLDFFRADQAAFNAATRVRGVFDAGSGPLRMELPYSLALTGFVSYQAMMDAEWIKMQTYWQARTDASCIALNGELPSRCADHMHLQRHHITTSFFFHQDLLDYVAGEQMFTKFFPDPSIGGSYLPGTAAWVQSTKGLSNLQDIHMLREYTGRRYIAEFLTIMGDPQWMPPGIFAPRCKGHVALPFASAFNGRLIDVAGVPTSLSTGLVTWLATGNFAAYATPGTTAMPAAVCPP
jgi:Pectinacetylesterase